jgi:hypothetical protein
VPVRASTWTSLMDAVATTPAAHRRSTSTSGKLACPPSARLGYRWAAEATVEEGLGAEALKLSQHRVMQAPRSRCSA